MQRANSVIAVMLLIVAVFYSAIVLDVCGPLAAQQEADRGIQGVRVECPPKGFCIDGRIVRVIDGDTLVVRSEVEYRVRLLDCWAPESRTKDIDEKTRGLTSKARMTELAQDKSCRVFMPTARSMTDMMTFGRVLGRIWITQDGKPEAIDLSGLMVSEGLATTTKQVKP
jgi:endonuclease YncB( thermonuclease family)